MNRRHALLIGTAALAGCASKPEPPKSQTAGITDPSNPAPPAGPLSPKNEMEFSFALEIPDSNSAPITVQDTFKFRSGERFRLQWKANIAAHVYIFNRGPKTSSYVRLAPEAGRTSMIGAANETPARIPAGESEWLRLDKVPGDEQMVVIACRAAIPVLERPGGKFSVEEFDRILIALERSRRPRSLRRFDEGHWHKCVAAGPHPELAVVIRLPLYHEQA